MRRGLLQIIPAMIAGFLFTTIVHADVYKPTVEDDAEVLFYSMPDAYFRNLVGEAVVVDGQTLNPKIQYYLDSRKSDVPPEAKRAQLADYLRDPAGRTAVRAAIERAWTIHSKITAPMKYTEDLAIPGPGGVITARAYVPETGSVDVLPVIVYFHGGGWLFASVDAVDRAMRLLANEADAIVISSNYRLGPEHKFPAAHDDAYAVYQWARAHAAAFGGDPARVAIGGDSAGGNMAASVSLRLLQEKGAVPALQLLYYPAVDGRMERYPSYETFSTGYDLDKSFLDMMETLVFTKRSALTDLRVSPILAKSLKGMPPAIVATAGFDMLRDQGKVYTDRLRREGVESHYLNYPTLIHGFMQWSGVIDDAEKAAVETARLAGKMLRQKKEQKTP